MLYGAYVYLCSNSLRRASRILEPFVERSHEAIRQWVQRLAPICDRFSIERRDVRSIFVDETMVKVKGRQRWLWVACEPHRRIFLGFRVSYNQSILDAALFLRELRTRYGRKPIWTDDAHWYPDACLYLRLEHHVYTDEWKNLIERMNQALKDRLECFDDLFPCFREECDEEHIRNWVIVFRFFHNHVRENEGTGRAPLQEDHLPEHQRFIRLIMECP
jgi:putative transposase